MASRTCRNLVWLLLGLAALVIVWLPWPAFASVKPTTRTIVIEARQFAYTPGEIRVNPGDTVTLRLVSTDVVHGLYVDGYGLSVEADPGQSATLTFVADKPGSFRIRCNVTCGALHPFMIGKLTVGAPLGFYRSLALSSLALLAILVPSLTTRRFLNTGH